MRKNIKNGWNRKNLRKRRNKGLKIFKYILKWNIK